VPHEKEIMIYDFFFLRK